MPTDYVSKIFNAQLRKVKGFFFFFSPLLAKKLLVKDWEKNLIYYL